MKPFTRKWRPTLIVAAAAACSVALVAPAAAAASTTTANWPSAGQNISNTRSQSSTTISTSNAKSLTKKWTFTAHGSVSATPSVAGGVVYVPDWGGYLNAINASTGATIWSYPISKYDGVAGSVARDTPAVYGSTIILGDQNGAHVFAVNRNTGALVWSTQVDRHPEAIITANPVIYDGMVYVGVSSHEEIAAANPSYPCCTFRGSMVALRAKTGTKVWKTYTVPPNQGKTGGYSGGAVWDTPAIDPGTGLIYFGTGNNYSVPASVAACEAAADPPGSGQCTSKHDYFDAIMALNLRNGKVAWTSKSIAYDTWTVACFAGASWCPSKTSPDYDMGGSGPNLMTVTIKGQSERVVGIGQKSGVYWLFDAATGKLLWHKLVGPGGTFGGIEWGTAYGGRHIYVAIADSNHTPYNPTENGKLDTSVTLTGGSWAALDPATGEIVWQTGDPTTGAVDMGPVSVAGGVVFAGSDGTGGAGGAGAMYALNGDTGQIEWSFPTAGSVNSGPAIVGGDVFWGSGYSPLSGLGITTKDNKLYMFSAS